MSLRVGRKWCGSLSSGLRPTGHDVSANYCEDGEDDQDDEENFKEESEDGSRRDERLGVASSVRVCKRFGHWRHEEGAGRRSVAAVVERGMAAGKRMPLTREVERRNKGPPLTIVMSAAFWKRHWSSPFIRKPTVRSAS